MQLVEEMDLQPIAQQLVKTETVESDFYLFFSPSAMQELG